MSLSVRCPAPLRPQPDQDGHASSQGATLECEGQVPSLVFAALQPQDVASVAQYICTAHGQHPPQDRATRGSVPWLQRVRAACAETEDGCYARQFETRVCRAR